MDGWEILVPLTAIVMGIGMPLILAAMVMVFQTRKTERLHEFALRLAEKGQPLPPEFLLGKASPYSDLRRGLVLVGLGIGLSVCLWQIGVPWGFGLIPLFMGIGYLMVWKLDHTESGGKT